MLTDSKVCPSGGAYTGSNIRRGPEKVEIGFVIGSIVRPQVSRVRMANGWVRGKFGYEFARPTKSAYDVYEERRGVCRDFTHLALTFCRCMNIPARYATGYLGDIGVPAVPSPMDFSAWFEVYLGGRWWTADARHHLPRIGRVLMATGRDATDCAITTSFGQTTLKKFVVITDEVKTDSAKI